jgi:Fur family transcriptional regulator, peroxide stress response regulator
MKSEEAFKNLKQGQLHSLCKAKGLPLTVQRTVIMDELAGRRDHPTADQVYDGVKAQLGAVSRTTVYRVLETFVAHGLVQKISSSEAKAHFDANATRHHHLECIQCGAIADIPHHPSFDIPLPSLVDDHFRVLDYAILFRGVCARCSLETQQQITAAKH